MSLTEALNSPVIGAGTEEFLETKVIVYVSAIQFAVNFFSPVLPCGISLLGDHPLKVFPAFVGARSSMVPEVIS